MGNVNTKIYVEFDRQIYFTNERITGNVHLDVLGDNDVLKINNVFFMIKCVFVLRTNQGDAPMNVFESFRSVLASPQPPETKLSFKKGHYSWTFSIPINEYLPPSFTTQIENLHYFALVTLEKSRFRSDIIYTKDILICPHVDLRRDPITPLTFTDNKENNGNIILNGTLDKCGYAWGEKIKCKLEIFNTRRLSIKNVVISIFYNCSVSPTWTVTFRPSFHTRTILERTIISIKDTCEEMISEMIDIEIPSTYIPPSFNHIAYIKTLLNTNTTRTINIAYKLKIVLKAEGILTDINVLVPIIIGTIPNVIEETNGIPRITYPIPADETNICDDKE